MAVITFISDFGEDDHYVAAVKASIISKNPSISVIDISHKVKPGDIAQAAYLLSCCFRDFPKGTVHLCSVGYHSKDNLRLIAIKLEDHFFVGFDNGIFSLLSENRPTISIDINKINPIASSFPSKNILAPIATKLASGSNIHELGETIESLTELITRKLKVTKREIAGNVIRVDHYGNLITNIVKNEFETIQKLNGNSLFQITIGRESVTKIDQNYFDVDSGDCFVFFNSNDFLEIGINKGNAAELLGLKLDTPIIINFQI